MDSFTSMKNKLEPLGLYSLDGSGEIDCELKAYAEGLDILFEMIDELEREFFIPTAQSYGLSTRERFLGRERTDLPVSDRRDLLLYLEKTAKGDITEGGFAEFLQKIGLENYTLDISVNRSNIVVNISDQKTDGEKALIEKQIAAEIPAHMTLTVNFSE